MNQIPTEFDINQVKDFSQLEMDDIEIKPKNTNTISNNDSNPFFEFELPQEKFLYSEESFFTLQVQTGITGTYLHDWCDSPFNRLVIDCGNINIVNESEFGFFRVLTNNHNYKYNTRLSSTGVMRGADSSIWDMFSSKRKLFIHLYDPFSKFGISNFFKDLLPLYKMDIIRIKLYLNKNLIEHLDNTTGLTTSLTMTNPKLHLRLIDSPDLRKEYNKPITRNFFSYNHNVDNIVNGATKISSIIPFNNQLISGILVAQRPVSMLNDPDVNAKYSARFTISNATKGNIIIDGKPINKSKYDFTNAVENIRNLERFFLVDHLGSYISSYDMINYNNFPGYSHTDDSSLQYIHKGIELRYTLAFPFSNIEEYVIGQNGTATSGTAQLNIDINAVEDCQVDIFTKYMVFYNISEDGKFAVKR